MFNRVVAPERGPGNVNVTTGMTETSVPSALTAITRSAMERNSPVKVGHFS